MLSVNGLENNKYTVPFRELLSLHKDSDVMALVQSDLPPQPQPSSLLNPSYLFSFLVITDESSKNSTQQEHIKKLFRNKIKKWNEIVDTTLEEVRYTPRSLLELQKIIKIIFFESKIKILEEKLKLNLLLDPKMEKLLNRLQILVTRILTTPNLEKWKIRVKNTFGNVCRKNAVTIPELIKTPRRQLQGLLLPELPDILLGGIKSGKGKNIKRCFSDSILWQTSDRCPTSSEIEKTIVESRELQDLIERQKKSLHHQQRACEISLFTHEWGKNWNDKLLEAFAELNEEGAICAVGEKLSTLQVMQIFRRFQDDQKHEWKLIFLFGSIKYPTFVEIIQSIDMDVINLLNEILQRSREEAKQWFQEAFNLHRDGFISSCNRMKSKIDALAKRFRDDLEGHHLTENELNHIYELEDHIQLTMNTILNKLEILLQGIITHPETRHVLFVGIKKEYNLLLTRLSETRDYADRPAGCIWPIIYRNIFERSNLADTDLAFEIFGDWGIYRIEDYRNIGLLGTISENELHKLIKTNQNIFQLCIENLSTLGINTIMDWKRSKIFNSFMFKNFLAKKEICEKLTQLTQQHFQ